MMTTSYKKIVDGIDTATFILTDNQVIQKRQGALVWFSDTFDNDGNLLKKNARHSSYYPGHDRLIIEGYYLVVAANHNPATHNIVADSWVINGGETWHNTIKLTDEEIAADAVVLFNAKVDSITNTVQNHLNKTAQSWGYDNIISLCTYEGNSNPKYSAEGAAGKAWRSDVWWYCEVELAKIKAGTRGEPESAEVFITELPAVIRPII